MSLTLSLRRSSLAVALLGASAVAWAQPRPPQPQPPQQQPHAPHRSQQEGLSESVRRAERNGQVLSAEQVQSDGRDVNRVKIIDDKGRVRVFWDDPQSQSQDAGKRGNGRKGQKDQSRTRSDDDGDPTL